MGFCCHVLRWEQRDPPRSFPLNPKEDSSFISLAYISDALLLLNPPPLLHTPFSVLGALKLPSSCPITHIGGHYVRPFLLLPLVLASYRASEGTWVCMCFFPTTVFFGDMVSRLCIRRVIFVMGSTVPHALFDDISDAPTICCFLFASVESFFYWPKVAGCAHNSLQNECACAPTLMSTPRYAMLPRKLLC